MARCELMDGMVALHGAVSKHDGYYYRSSKHGRTYLCRKSQRKPLRPTPTQERNLERFRTAKELAQKALKSPVLRHGYEQKFKAQKKYISLQGFVMATIYKSLI